MRRPVTSDPLSRAEQVPMSPVDTPVEVRRNSTKAHEIVGFRVDSENPLVAGGGFDLPPFGL